MLKIQAREAAKKSYQDYTTKYREQSKAIPKVEVFREALELYAEATGENVEVSSKWEDDPDEIMTPWGERGIKTRKWYIQAGECKVSIEQCHGQLLQYHW